jgi:CheY-like chemotaxis protein
MAVAVTWPLHCQISLSLICFSHQVSRRATGIPVPPTHEGVCGCAVTPGRQFADARGDEPRELSDMPVGIATSDRFALVVEDNARAAEMTGAMLEAQGWQVDIARDGFEAITRVRNKSYGVLLLDYRLPGMDGVEVLTWVRRNLTVLPPVLVVSGESVEFLRLRFDGMGVRAILPKPLTAPDLIGALPV